MAFAHGGIEQIDQLDALSAIWILSCIDENPILTYRGIVNRLNLDEKLDIPALVGSRRELFRPGVLKSRLEDWKQKMRAGKSLPGWILEIEDGTERTKVIDGLSRSDVFRNQFRVPRNAPKCDLEIIDWGLQHLDRLRKGALEARDEKIKRVSTLFLPAGAIITSLFVGLGSLFGSIYLQRMTANDLRELKQYEVSFKPKQEGYANLMSALQDVMLATFNGNEMKVLSEINRMESSFHALEPFLDASTRVEIFRTLSQFIQFCADEVVKKPPISGADINTLQSDRYKAAIQQIAVYKTSFQTRLFDALFPGGAGQQK
jgi:hypothetical protein